MARKRKFNTLTTSIENAISDAIGEATSLGEECREVCDNMPESLQSTSRYEALDNAANELEGLDEPEVPEVLKEVQVTYGVELPRSRRHGLSRASRASNAEGTMRSVIDAAQEWLDNAEAEYKAKFGDDEPEDDSEYSVNISAVEELRDACEEIAEKLSGVEFPGMYG
jgi:hypothetical protein